MAEEQVTLVDEQDLVLGSMDKMEAHLKGLLHRAFSVFIFDSDGNLLIQQRAANKYHSGGKWTNTCCSHPRMGEKTTVAAHRRLFEEMGMRCELDYVFNFTYKTVIQKNITEYEFDHVFFGISNQKPVPDLQEVADYRYLSMQNLARELDQNPDQFTKWLQICFRQVLMHHNQFFQSSVTGLA